MELSRGQYRALLPRIIPHAVCTPPSYGTRSGGPKRRPIALKSAPHIFIRAVYADSIFLFDSATSRGVISMAGVFVLAAYDDTADFELLNPSDRPTTAVINASLLRSETNSFIFQPSSPEFFTPDIEGSCRFHSGNR